MSKANNSQVRAYVNIKFNDVINSIAKKMSSLLLDYSKKEEMRNEIERHLESKIPAKYKQYLAKSHRSDRCVEVYLNDCITDQKEYDRLAKLRESVEQKKSEIITDLLIVDVDPAYVEKINKILASFKI